MVPEIGSSLLLFWIQITESWQQGYRSKASLKGYNAFFRPDFPRESSGSCLPPSIPSIPVKTYRPLFKAWLARGYNSQYHTEWSPTEWHVINTILGLWAALTRHSSFKQVIMKNMDHLDVNKSNFSLCNRASN